MGDEGGGGGHLSDFLLEKAKYSGTRNSNAKGTEEKEGKSLTPLEKNKITKNLLSV